MLLRCKGMASDTNAEARKAQIDAIRGLGVEERVRLALTMSEEARELAIEGAMRRAPNLTREQAKRDVFARMWGADLFAKVEAYLAETP